MSSMAEPTAESHVLRSAGRPRPKPVIPNGVLGMLVFVLTEIMFFAGLISAYLIAKGAATTGWPPPGQPRLPIEETAVNTAALLLSGVVLLFANRAFADRPAHARRLLVVTMLLGTFFVGFQGAEWLALLREGLTITTSTHGSFFYLLIGAHALHAVAALGSLLYAYGRLRRGTLDRSTFWAVQVFWYFVVGVWPVLYHQVYL